MFRQTRQTLPSDSALRVVFKHRRPQLRFRPRVNPWARRLCCQDSTRVCGRQRGSHCHRWQNCQCKNFWTNLELFSFFPYTIKHEMNCFVHWSNKKGIPNEFFSWGEYKKVPRFESKRNSTKSSEGEMIAYFLQFYSI